MASTSLPLNSRSSTSCYRISRHAIGTLFRPSTIISTRDMEVLTIRTLQFTAIENESLWNRLIWITRRGWPWLHGDRLPPYSAHSRESSLSDLGYLLLEFVVDGRPLSSTWQEHRNDEGRRVNLFRGLANILLDLDRLPLARIGSWTMDNYGKISLTNRPLIDLTMLWNRHEIPTNIPRVR